MFLELFHGWFYSDYATACEVDKDQNAFSNTKSSDVDLLL